MFSHEEQAQYPKRSPVPPVAKRTPVPPLELPPETIEALAEAWAQLLLADLARRPPESSSGRAEAHP